MRVLGQQADFQPCFKASLRRTCLHLASSWQGCVSHGGGSGWSSFSVLPNYANVATLMLNRNGNHKAGLCVGMAPSFKPPLKTTSAPAFPHQFHPTMNGRRPCSCRRLTTTSDRSSQFLSRRQLGKSFGNCRTGCEHGTRHHFLNKAQLSKLSRLRSSCASCLSSW